MDNRKIDQLNEYLISAFSTKVMFTQNAIKDFKGFGVSKRNSILKMIIKQAEKGARLKPEGAGIRCKSPLHHFGKIKSKALNLRIIYKPSELKEGLLTIEIIAIGPRDNLEAYRLATQRLMG